MLDKHGQSRCSRGLAALFMEKNSDYQLRRASFNFSIADVVNYEDEWCHNVATTDRIKEKLKEEHMQQHPIVLLSQSHPNNYMLLKLCVQWIDNYYSKTYKKLLKLLIVRRPLYSLLALESDHFDLKLLNLSENILKMWIEHGRPLRRHSGHRLQISLNWLRRGIVDCLMNHLR